jgi:hypothetical protein
VNAPPIILCTAFFIIFIDNNLLIPLMNLTDFTIQTIIYGSETSDYNQNVKLFCAEHSFIKRSKRFDNNIVI